MTKIKKFPKVVFVTVENEGTRDEYFNIVLSPKEAASLDGPKRVGAYALQATPTVSVTVNTKYRKRK